MGLADALIDMAKSNPSLVYLILFGAFFFQTGFLIGPAIPGNPLLFAAGVASVSGNWSLNHYLVALITGLGAFLGNLVNYAQGAKAGPAFRQRGKFVDGIDRAEAYYAKKGRWAVALAAFLPFIRAFVPFVAGMGRMDRGAFALSSLVGAFGWTITWTLVGYFLGQIPVVAANANKIVMGIVVLVAVVATGKAIQYKRGQSRAAA